SARHLGIAAKTLLPELVREHSHARTLFPVFLRQKPATQLRFDPQHAEQTRRGVTLSHLFRAILRRKIEVARSGPIRHLLERAALRLPIREVGRRNILLLDAARRIALP